MQQSLWSLIDFSVHGDERGSLIAIESHKDIPFTVKRVYYIYQTQFDAVRGKHAHKDLEQIIFCPSGSCTFFLDDGKNKESIQLSRPDVGLYIKGQVWREFSKFSKDCVIIVLASEHYNPQDYIKNYDDFLKSIA